MGERVVTHRVGDMEKAPKHFGRWLSGREVQLKLMWQEDFLEEVSARD